MFACKMGRSTLNFNFGDFGFALGDAFMLHTMVERYDRLFLGLSSRSSSTISGSAGLEEKSTMSLARTTMACAIPLGIQ